MENLIKIQQELVAKKDGYNTFGKFSFRSAEQILENVKPLLKKYNCTILIEDELEVHGDWHYVKSTIKFFDLNQKENVFIVQTSSYAREDENRSGISQAQSTGCSSSYARKYALGAMFLIDDADNDPDTQENGGVESKKKTTSKKNVQSTSANERINASSLKGEYKEAYEKAIKDVKECKSTDDLQEIWKSNAGLHNVVEFISEVTSKKTFLSK